MSARFNTILIPVDFTLNTQVAIAKTLGLLEDADAAIHLLHVARPSWILRTLRQVAKTRDYEFQARIEQRLEELVLRIQKVKPGIRVITWTDNTQSVEKAITAKASFLSADLLVIGKHSSNWLLPFGRKVIPARIATATGVPVLTVKPGSLKNPVRTVVIPVGPKFPKKKLELLHAWRDTPDCTIRLVSCLSHDKDDAYSKDSLLNTFRLLKTSWPGSVEYDVLRGNNHARALLNYCKKVNADMLIVYPGEETNAGVFPARYISDLLPVDSRTQILAIQPV
ncbi:universal stress protein [Terrimonas sp. NA20]|uniref:Universal stress protein n=1 Tax=Terrimonas ginsenosidimutans TaxID=2908004 RepID=A0ABS9KXK9_9BACT|nr:universal stress protein [Terrimonas ginsenosidimutans]MCG2617023.1 universal stress protein [Terrimonas ginsenosidimutans]